jgi:hypothetical protein
MAFKEQELVEVYNKAPNSLLNKVVRVSVKQDSITAINRNSIILASIGNGNYWVIHDVDINYWLLPKAKLKIEQYRREIVELLFDCDDYEPEYYSFELTKPAQVSILANKQEWKLEKRGVLKFINSSDVDEPRKESDIENQLKSSNNSLIEPESFINSDSYLEASIERLSERINEIENKLSTTQYLEASIERLSERISELEENKLQVAKNKEPSVNYYKNTYQSLNLEPPFNPFDQNVNLSQSDNITQPSENSAYLELVNTYNINPKLLEQAAIKVSEPTDSINKRHSDSTQKIVLEKVNNSNYWVIHDGVGIDCWLLPKINLRIDQFRYETTKALFECRGYNPKYSTFKLVKPAKVIPLSNDEQTWQLESPGILEFMLKN